MLSVIISSTVMLTVVKLNLFIPSDFMLSCVECSNTKYLYTFITIVFILSVIMLSAVMLSAFISIAFMGNVVAPYFIGQVWRKPETIRQELLARGSL
jgi:hypothetical protein